MKKPLICLLLCLLLALPALAESQPTAGFDTAAETYATPEEEIAALQAHIAELEATIANLEERLSQYESLLDVQVDPNADVITFNGGSVKLSVAQAAYDETAALYEQFGVNKADYADMLKTDVLNTLAEEAILTLKAQELGIYENTAEQQAYAEAEATGTFDAMIAYYAPYFTTEDTSEEEAKALAEEYIAAEGVTYDTLLEQIIASQWKQRLFDAVTAEIVISEEEIRTMYDNGLAAAKEKYADLTAYEYDVISGEMIYTHPEGYRSIAYVGLSYTEAEMNMDADARIASVSARYADLIERATGGEDMAVLAEEYLLFDYGSMPIRADGVLMSDAFNQTAMALQLNETSAPVNDDNCAWILRYTGDIESGDVPYETMQFTLMQTATETARSNAYNALVDQWLTDANILTFPDMLR